MSLSANLDRRRFLGTVAAATTAASVAPLQTAGAASSGPRPNVLVIQPDQHRGTIMGCAGDPQAITPNLDRLAAGGMHFTHCASSSPVCSPFRGTMQTGLYPHKHGVLTNGIRLNPEFRTIAEEFSDAGYATGYIGKWHLDGGLPKEQPGGFVPEGIRRQGWQQWHGYEKSHEFLDVWQYDDQARKVPVEGYNWEPTWHTDMALEFAGRNGEANTPWLYYVAYGPPHKPEQCPQEFLDMYPPESFTLPPDLDGKLPPDVEAVLREILQVYYAQITAVDHEVGRLLAGLEELGQLDNTIILYTSDHGDKLGSHCPMKPSEMRGKGAPMATAFRIPLIVHWPKSVQPGQVCDALVSSVDLAPTLLDLAGLDVPKPMQGTSMAPWCLSGTGPRNEMVYLGIGNERKGWRGLWDGRYVYSQGSHEVLWDHQQDPYEMTNLYGQEDARVLQDRLHGRLRDLAKTLDDPWAGKL